MESQSTVTDSVSLQVEQALLESVPPQCEVTSAEAPVELPVTIERDKESVARAKPVLDVEDADAVGESDEEVVTEVWVVDENEAEPAEDAEEDPFAVEVEQER